MDLAGVEIIALDEVALWTGHRYATVVMDMNPAYEEEVRTHCPQAEMVFYHLFHSAMIGPRAR